MQGVRLLFRAVLFVTALASTVMLFFANPLILRPRQHDASTFLRSFLLDSLFAAVAVICWIAQHLIASETVSSWPPRRVMVITAIGALALSLITNLIGFVIH